MGAECSCCCCGDNLTELTIEHKPYEDETDPLFWVAADENNTAGDDEGRVTSEDAIRLTQVKVAHHERLKAAASRRVASRMIRPVVTLVNKSLAGARDVHETADPMLLTGLIRVLLMMGEVMNGAQKQAMLTGEELPPVQPTISMVLSIGCIIKQCVEEPRYRQPLGVGNVSLGIGDEGVLRLAARYARFAIAAYLVSDSSHAVKHISDRIAEDPWHCEGPGQAGVDILQVTPQHKVPVKHSRRVMSIKSPATFFAKDRLNGGALVLAIRGTKTLSDAITDCVATPVRQSGRSSFINGYAHVGMVHAASAIMEKDRKLMTEYVTEQLRLHDLGGAAAPLVITGHSLGGGVAICLLFMLLNVSQATRRACKLGLVKVYTFGAPSTVSMRPPQTWSAKEVYLAALLTRGQVLWCFVNDFDPIPRFGVRSALQIFLAARHVRMSHVNKLAYLKFGKQPDERLPDYVVLLPLGEHAGYVSHATGGPQPAAHTTPVHADASSAAEAQMSAGVPQAASSGAPASAAKQQSGSSSVRRARRTPEQLLAVWRKTVKQLMVWMRRFNRLMTRLHQVGTVVQMYRDKAGTLHCQRMVTDAYGTILFHEGFASCHLMRSYCDSLDAAIRGAESKAAASPACVADPKLRICGPASLTAATSEAGGPGPVADAPAARM